MAKKNDKTVVTEAYLSKFANEKLKTFLDTEDEPYIGNIMGYIPSTESSAPTGSTDTYVTLSPGNTNVLLQAYGLRNAHDKFSGDLQLNVTALFQIAKKLQQDLLQVEQILGQTEDDAALTAEEMSFVIGDIWQPTSTTTYQFPGGEGNS